MAGVLHPWKAGKRTDLPQFYAGARLAYTGQVSRIYDRGAYQDIVPAARSLEAGYNVYFNRPAFEAILLAPAGALPYDAFEQLWMTGNYALLILLAWWIPRWFSCPPGFRIWLLCFHPFLQAVYMGQDTLWMTLLAAAGIRLIIQERDIQGGALLAVCCFKPHLLWAVPIVLLILKRRRAAIGFLATAACLGLVSAGLVGVDGLKQWWNLLHAPTTDASVGTAMGNLRTIATQFGWPCAVVLAAAALFGFAGVLRGASLVKGLASAVFLGPVFAPHSYLADYALAAIAAGLSPVPFLRYLVVIPWTYFYPYDTEAIVDGVPFVFMAVTFVAVLGWFTESGPESKKAFRNSVDFLRRYGLRNSAQVE